MVAYLAGGRYRVYRSPRDASILASAEFSWDSVMPFSASYGAISRLTAETNEKQKRILCDTVQHAATSHSSAVSQDTRHALLGVLSAAISDEQGIELNATIHSSAVVSSKQ